MESAHCNSNPANDFRLISLLPQRCDLLQHDDMLLRPNIVNGGYSSVDHYLDVQFRLLREDFLCGIREGIQSYLSNKRLESYDNIRVFKNVKFLKLNADLHKTGYLVQLQKKDVKNKKSDTDIFMYGSLLVFTCDEFRNVLISTVINSDKNLLDKGQIIVTIPDDYFSHLSMQDLYMNNFTMIESEVYFEPYYYVLKALQHEDLVKDFPMKKYIIYAKPHVAPPSYVYKPRQLIPHSSFINKLGLNESQYDAYTTAVNNEFVVIQGPPGTGKTHLGLKVAEAILANGCQAMPMLVICFTNHALDQFLEGLLNVTNKIVRIGGRSKSEKLEAYNLSKIRKDNHVKMSQSTYRAIIQPLKLTVEEMVKIEETLKSGKYHDDDDDDDDNDNDYDDDDGDDDNGYDDDDGDDDTDDDHDHDDYYENNEGELEGRFTKLHALYERYSQNYKQHLFGKDRVLLKNAEVIGMTTTGAARLQPLLRSLQAPVVIVEEAAEVLEAHIIASLTKHCQHLILIGDHKQLQPSSASYVLGQKYNLKISLFERMITNGIHSRTLKVQHRMRTEIAALIAPAIYKDLKNNPSVEKFPPVRGLKENVYFINHNNYEDTKQNNDTSHSNRFEAQFLIRLAIYLLQQGYKAKEVTILATYKGQTLLLKDLAYNHNALKDVVISTVDNYQGEENKIVLLSLVRCNKSQSIGFLAKENRVCVALSRAREGFYMIGCMDALKRRSSLWKQIAITLEQQNSLSTALPLMCHYHPNIITMVSKGRDFDKIRDGQCRQYCDVALKCGHKCTLICHQSDREHKEFKCLKPCERKICNLHPCPKHCYERCSACVVKVTKNLLCGHSAKVECYLPIDKVVCREPCKKFNANCSVTKGDSHKCRKMCFQNCDPCPVVVIKQSQNCPHLLKILCNLAPLRKLCVEKCTRLLPCGHPCVQNCREECNVSLCRVMVIKKSHDCPHVLKLQCNQAPVRKFCVEKCVRLLSCDHSCIQNCREKCDASLCQEMVPSISWMKSKNRFLLPCNIKQSGLFSSKCLSYLLFGSP